MWSINQSANDQSEIHVTRISEIRHTHENFNRRLLSSEWGQTVDSFLVLSLPLKVAKSPNLRRLSRDLLLEILDSIADYLKDCNIAVSSWWNGTDFFTAWKGRILLKLWKRRDCSHLKWTFGHWNLPLPTPIGYWRKKDRLSPMRGWLRLKLHWKLKFEI